ncbi:MAG: transporter [Deltaproteobacteria bacterium]|nr:transporter [Deltaproteobacteria bacterium]
MESDQESGASLKLPHNLELNVSFLYNREAPSQDHRRHNDSLPLFNYSMDYRLLPNFKVGLSGYLYYPATDQPFSLNRPFGERVMGLGPGVKYDLGRWSFVFKTQMETGARGDDLQNWLQVWYAF